MKSHFLQLTLVFLLICQGFDSTIGDQEIEYDDLNFQMFDGGKNLQIGKKDFYRTSTLVNLIDQEYDEGEDKPDLTSGDWKWCLLSLTGNATILQLRRDDFINYLRINLASLIASNYDHIIFNSVSYTPAILVNVSLNFKDRHSRIVSSLTSLARHNDTLFDLSGTHYNLTDFLPSYALTAPKSEVTPFASAADSGESSSSTGLGNPREIEAIIYVAVGGAIAFLLTASLLFTVCQCIVLPKRRRESGSEEGNRSRRRKSGFSEYSLDNYQQPQQPSFEESPSRSIASLRSVPKLIYSRGFSDSLLASPAETEMTAMTPSISGHSSSFVQPDTEYVRRQSRRLEEEDISGKRTFGPQRDIIYHRRENDDDATPLLFGPRRSISKPTSVVGNTEYQTVIIQDPLYQSHHHHHHHRPSSALSSFKPLPPPASFATPPPAPPPSILLSPTSSTTSSRSGQPPHKWSRVNRPSDEEIARDVRIVFQNMGLESSFDSNLH